MNLICEFFTLYLYVNILSIFRNLSASGSTHVSLFSMFKGIKISRFTVKLYVNELQALNCMWNNRNAVFPVMPYFTFLFYFYFYYYYYYYYYYFEIRTSRLVQDRFIKFITYKRFTSFFSMLRVLIVF